MNRTLFITLLLLQIFLFILWSQLGLSFGGILIFLFTIGLVTLRRKYLNMRPLLGGRLEDIPRYFKKP